ncbi:hypothetical protein IAT38_001473 [Cryptococcus sp. DSM 104549]
MPPHPLIRGSSTHAIGTAFENHALAVLNARMSMSLRRVGGAYDGGVDLRGWWYLPKGARPDVASGADGVRGVKGEEGEGEMFWKNEKGEEVRRIRVLAQCKALASPVAARPIRELEGVLSQLNYQPAGGEVEKAVAVLIAQRGFSKDAMLHATRSRVPLLLLSLPGGQYRPSSTLYPDSDEGSTSSSSEGEGGGEDLKIESAWWNRALSEDLLGGKMELRREVLLGKGVKTTTGLWMGGRRVGRCVPGSVEEEEDL